MKNQRSEWMPIAADLAMAVSYLAFGLSAILTVSDLVATLFDGKIYISRLLFDASFAAWGLLLRHLEKKYKNSLTEKL